MSAPFRVSIEEVLGAAIGADNPVPVSVQTVPADDQTVDLNKVAGAAVATGHGTAAGAVRVELPTDGTGVVGLAAGAALVGKVSAGLDTATIYSGTTALTPKFAAIDAATSGDNQLVAAVVDKKIRVLSLFLVAADAVSVRFESGTGGTALTGQMAVAANGGFCLPFNPAGWFETAANTLLNLELSGAVSVDGSLVYVEV